MKIYLVTVSAGAADSPAVEQTRLIRANTKAGALAFAVEKHISVALPTQDQLVRAATSGTKIEDATKQATQS